jgi:hypothetical protein
MDDLEIDDALVRALQQEQHPHLADLGSVRSQAAGTTARILATLTHGR